MGRARHIDDINVTGQLWAAFGRSPESHAKIVSIDAEAPRRSRACMPSTPATTVDRLLPGNSIASLEALPDLMEDGIA